VAAEPGEEPSAGSESAEGIAELAAGAAGGVDGPAGDAQGIGLGLGGRQQLFLVGWGGEWALPGLGFRIHSSSSYGLPGVRIVPPWHKRGRRAVRPSTIAPHGQCGACGRQGCCELWLFV
jgi:hypothetical protein